MASVAQAMVMAALATGLVLSSITAAFKVITSTKVSGIHQYVKWSLAIVKQIMITMTML